MVAILRIITGELKVIKHFIVALLALFLSSCSEKEAPRGNSIVVATSADNPPYEFIQDGKIVGLDIDIIKAIGESLGKEIVIKNLDFPGLFPAISGNNVDLVIAAISYTPERAEHFSFSKTYASSSMAILYRKADDFKSVSDLKGKVIGAQLASTWDLEAQKIAKEQSGMVRSLANNLVLVEELRSASVDAIVLERMQVQKFIDNNPDLASFALPDSKSDFAIAFSKDSELLTIVDKAIDDLESSGKLIEIKKRWMQ